MVAGLIVDASIALTWLLDDEDDAGADAAISTLRQGWGIVPQHWHYEVRNGLLVAVRRSRLLRDDLAVRLRSLVGLPLNTDLDSNLGATLDLAFAHDLTFYDALYLELAIRADLPLATLDSELQNAANASGVEVFSA